MPDVDEANPRRVRWTWGAAGALLVIVALLLLLNQVYSAGGKVLALVLLAIALVIPGAWQVYRSRHGSGPKA